MENAIWHAWNEQQTFPEGKDFFLYFGIYAVLNITSWIEMTMRYLIRV